MSKCDCCPQLPAGSCNTLRLDQVAGAVAQALMLCGFLAGLASLVGWL